jgi:hypothetical protein
MEATMQFRKRLFLAPVGMGILLLTGMLLLWMSGDADAQCGSQASSCKNCHETQAQDPVNSDGTGWHVSHAFGDFCYLCHAGNNQSTDKAQAHTGMVAPMSDVQAACASCHPADLAERANVYAAVLGVEAGMGGGTTGAPSSGVQETGGPEVSEPLAPPIEAAQPELMVGTSELVDFGQQYDETVLGKKTINWGNMILWIMIAGTALGGGLFVFMNERKLRGLPTLPSAYPIPEKKSAEIPEIAGYSREVASLLPLIANLNPQGLHSLRKILADPNQANEILYSLSKLDPELVRRLKALDHDSRALLVAVSGD